MTKPLAPASNGVECVAESAPIELNLAKVGASILLSVAPAIITST